MSFSFLSNVITLASSLIALGLAAFVLWCNRRSSANRWLALGLFVISFHQGLVLASRFAPSDLWHVVLLRAAFGVAAAMPSAWLGFNLTFRESTGKPRVARWFPLLPCVTLVAFGTSVPLVFGRGVRLVSIETAGHTMPVLDGWGTLLLSTYLVGLVLVLLHLENLYRSATPSVRHKLRILVVGLFVALGCQIAATSYTLLFRFIHPSHGFVSAAGFLIGQVMIAFALVRHRLLDSNIYVSRYVIYRSLTLALVGGYLLALGILAEIFKILKINLDFLTGTFLTIAGGAALTLLLLSERMRRKAKGFIQAHFYRHKYDYREEWMEFTRDLAHATTDSAVAMRTIERVLNVMWVQQAAIYMRENEPGVLKLLHQVGYRALPSQLTLSPNARRMISEGAAMLPSSGRREDSSTDEVQLSRDLFPNVPVGQLVPLVALDSLAGLLVVGPEMSGKPFGVDDRDLLAAVAAQASAMIVNARLTQQAAEDREIQALARLSAFVAHDLKNSVGMLSLLAENAPSHIHNADFQKDAIRTLTEVTERMQRLLGTLRASSCPPLTITSRTNFAAVVETWLRDFKPQIPTRVTVEARLEPTPDVLVNPEQLRTVLVNLVLNAVDAISNMGRITVETRTEEGWATFTVSDTGRGMSADFIRDRLFRPFHTTKPRGLGIGLYQCRSIIQACGGEITADSQDGVGTRMTVRLPVVAAGNLTAEDAEDAKHAWSDRPE